MKISYRFQAMYIESKTYNLFKKSYSFKHYPLHLYQALIQNVLMKISGFQVYRFQCELELKLWLRRFRSSRPEVLLEKYVLKICSKFTGEYPCRSLISIRLLWNFIEITLRHECSPVNLLYISEDFFLRTPLDGCFWRFLGN